KGSRWRPREQAGRNVSERRIGPETLNAGADPADIWGRLVSSMSGEQPDPIDGPAGVVATACLHRRTNATREAPAVASARQPNARGGQVGPFGVSERSIVPMKPVMMVEGRDLSSRSAAEPATVGEWRKPVTSVTALGTADAAARLSEERLSSRGRP